MAALKNLALTGVLAAAIAVGLSPRVGAPLSCDVRSRQGSDGHRHGVAMGVPQPARVPLMSMRRRTPARR